MGLLNSRFKSLLCKYFKLFNKTSIFLLYNDVIKVQGDLFLWHFKQCSNAMKSNI